MTNDQKPMTPDEVVKTAEAMARKAHAFQVRKFTGLPYIVHPEAVANSAAIRWSPTLTAVAWLHDVLEDTPTTTDDLLAAGIPIEIIDHVVRLTKFKNESYFDYIADVAKSVTSSAVKIADLTDNLKDLPAGEKRDKYLLARAYLNKIYETSHEKFRQ
jgi:(p)ppGpp synthase/HD superfamily hydrolase